MGLHISRKRPFRKFKSLSRRRKGATNLRAPLCKLPLELIELVASWLQPSDLGALRLICKALYAKLFHVFWKTSLHTVKTDLSYASLGKLEAISRDTQLAGYVKHMVFMGFDKDAEDLGEGYYWASHRHLTGYLVNLQTHPAVNRLSNILSHLNCKSFEVHAVIILARDQSDYDNLRPTDTITILLDIAAMISLPFTALFLNFDQDYTPDSQRLRVSDKSQFAAIGQHLEEMKLHYAHDDGIVRDWTFNFLCHAPNLRTLHLRNTGRGEAALTHNIALVDGMWSQLREFRLICVPMLIDDLMVLLKRCRYTLQVFEMRNMRVDGDCEGIRKLFSTLSTFPELESFVFNNVKLGVYWRHHFINFPVLAENPFVDESRGHKFDLSVDSRGRVRVWHVAYSGPKMDVALDILAKTAVCIPRDMWFIY